MTTDVPLEGVLPVDKPIGPTSHDVVGAVRRALRTRRVGHTGTLDPFASGLLLVCVGSATRIAEYLTGLNKRYAAQVRLGVATDTDDATGAVLSEAGATAITRAAVEAVLAGMTGDVLQRPPAYSAKKVAGERAYAAARAGRALELEPVRVRIDELRITVFEPPVLELDVACGSGTYIRAIARDLGEALGVGAHLSALRRTRVGDHDVAGAVPVAELGDTDRVRAAMIPSADALSGMPKVTLDEGQLAHIRHGRPVKAAPGDDGVVALVASGTLVAIGQRTGDVIRPRKVMA
ncbi:MAG TPA: tRNA pseudouridine(55) synthase TruB [Longimicrobiales bacterium]|nr:tRNA pseudouridine(55) synthase TruB [Longimicrobiales bacterium]